MSGPSLYFTLPSLSLFKFPPDNLPAALPPPSDEATWRSPFPISYDTFNNALDIKVPLTVAASYIVAVTLVNAFNRHNGNKAWWISTTRPFKVFVILHNVFLALYSAVTFYAMLRAISHTWPGWDNTNGLAGVADALCKVNGPRGLGDATTYNAATSAWEVKNKLINLLPEGTPDPTDVGRLWNEGLAFWGWWFYLSKFYEVLDTFIIVAKGKRSATLQTYHHAGAMLCMWAGIRYMSPPIWMFVFLNSAIHAMMVSFYPVSTYLQSRLRLTHLQQYTYFTLSALGIRVPMSIKRTLTTMQISQFLFGATYAAAHLFVKYDIPISTAYTIFHPIASMLNEATSTASELAASATSVASSPFESYGAVLKRVLLRAAGEEGVAENVRDGHGQVVLQGAKEAVQKFHEETRWSTDYHTINCIDTTGASFAIWLNLFYLAPLTALFVRFFIRAYTRRSGTGTNKQTKRHAAGRSAIEAAKGVDREVDEVGKFTERKLSHGFDDLDAEVKKDLQKLKDAKNSARPISEQIKSVKQRALSLTREQAEAAKRAISSTPTKSDTAQIKEDAANSIDDLKEHFKAMQSKTESKTETKTSTSESTSSLSESKNSLADSKASLVDLKDSIFDSKSSLDSERPGTSGSISTSQSTPSKKKRKNKKKNRKTAQNGGAEAGAEHDHDDESDDDHDAEHHAEAIKQDATPEFKKEDPASGGA